VAKNMVLKNVGAIHELVIPVPEEGGVVELKGPNGCGKSTALRAAQGILGDKKDRSGLRHHDDAEKGSVSLGDCTITLGRTNRSSGALDVHSLAGHVDLGDIVDPQIEDPLRADKRRIEAIFKVAGASMEGTELKKLLPEEDIKDIEWKDSSWQEPILDVADKLRTVFTERARKLEKESLEKNAQAKAMRVGKHEAFTRPSDEDVQTAKDNFQAQTEEGIKLAERKRLADEQFSRVAKARREMDEIGGTDLKSLIESIDKGMLQAYGLLQQFDAEIKKHQEKVRDLEAAKIQTLADHNSLSEKKDIVLHQQKVREQLESVIAESVQPITEEQVQAQRKVVAEAQAQWDELRQAVVDADVLAKAQKLEADAESVVVKGKKARDIAGPGIDKALGQLIGQVFPGSQFMDGRLAVTHPKRGVTYFGELSDGERWTVVLDLATSLCPESTMLVVPQTAWEGLDGANRQKINAWAKEHKIVVMTAEASDDPAAEGIEARVLD
jgi:energy-coupling factor transporter ATP-binding protein EcfA2